MPVKTDVIFDAIESAAYTAHLEETVERLSRELDQADLLSEYHEYEFDLVCTEADLEQREAERNFLRLTSSLQTIQELEQQLFLEAEQTAALESLLKKSELKNKKLAQEVDDLYENIDCRENIDENGLLAFASFAVGMIFGAVLMFLV